MKNILAFSLILIVAILASATVMSMLVQRTNTPTPDQISYSPAKPIFLSASTPQPVKPWQTAVIPITIKNTGHAGLIRVYASSDNATIIRGDEKFVQENATENFTILATSNQNYTVRAEIAPFKDTSTSVQNINGTVLAEGA